MATCVLPHGAGLVLVAGPKELVGRREAFRGDATAGRR